MAPPNTTLYDLAQTILTAVLAEYTAEGVAPPARQFISNGEVALDCKELAVMCQQVYYGTATGLVNEPWHATLGTQHATAVYQIWVVRCAPVVDDNGRAPEITAIQTSAAEVLKDGWILHEAVWQRVAPALLANACGDVSIQPLTHYGPQGGVVGWTQDLRVQLP